MPQTSKHLETPRNTSKHLETPRNTSKHPLILSLFFFVFLLHPFLSQAQFLGGQATKEINDQLRFLFGQTVPPSANYPALYDMSAHYTHERYWTNYSTDTTNIDNFTALYEELYYALYDTLDMLPIPDFWDPGYDFGNDTVVLALMDYNFYRLKQDALNDSNYFYVDTINEQLVDNPHRLSIPYTENNIFTICAFQEESRRGQLVYRIDPAFFVIDNYNMSTYYQSSLYDFQIDFNDGNGWITFDPTVITHHTVTYHDEAIFTIKARISSREYPDDDIKHSVAYKTAPMYKQVTPPDEFWGHIPGLLIGNYKACQITGENYEEKYFIYLAGIDILDKRNINDHAAALSRSNIMDLRNYGYNVLVVVWLDSKKSMVSNAMHVVDLIDYLKCNKLNTGNDIHPPFVLMGESMGGVIGRYALTYMESNPSQSTCFQDLMHNTRLFISQDAPHQGAYIPLAYQKLYEEVNDPLMMTTFKYLPYGNVFGLRKYFNLLDRVGVRQLLNVHVANNVGNNYYPHADRTAFMNQLHNLSPSTNGWPKHCKKVGITQGLLSGQHQLGSTENCISKEGDEYLKVEYEQNVQVLGFPLTGSFSSFNLRRLNQVGIPFYEWSMGVNRWGIQLKWSRFKIGICPICTTIGFPTGIEIGYISTTASSYNKTANNLPNYDIMPGGYNSTDFKESLENIKIGDYTVSVPPSYNLNFSLFGARPDIFKWSYSFLNNNGSHMDCEDDEIRAWNFNLILFGISLNAHTKSQRFSFIPMRSALDLNPSLNLDANIYSMPTSFKMSQTPFDVIKGEFNVNFAKQDYFNDILDTSFFGGRNEWHTNHYVYNKSLDNSDSVRINKEGSWLNREVGDSVLMLENLAMGFPAIIEAEKEIYGGINLNPYYEYPTVSSSRVLHFYNGLGFSNNGIFSDDRPLNTHPYMHLVAGQVHDWGIVNSYGFDLIERQVCDNTYSYNFGKKENVKTEVNTQLESENKIHVFPNPATKHINVQLSTNEEADINLYSMQGQLLMSRKIQFIKSESSQFNLYSNIPTGVYMLSIQTKKETFTKLINIQNQ